MKIKIYTNDQKVLDRVCKIYGLQPDYIISGYEKKVFGYGYCTEGRYLRVFCQYSAVDQGITDHIDITSDFTPKNFTL